MRKIINAIATSSTIIFGAANTHANTELVSIGHGENIKIMKSITLSPYNGGYCNDEFLSDNTTSGFLEKDSHNKIFHQNHCPPGTSPMCHAWSSTSYKLHDKYSMANPATPIYTHTEAPFYIKNADFYCDVTPHKHPSNTRSKIMKESIVLDGMGFRNKLVELEEFSSFTNHDNSGGEVVVSIAFNPTSNNRIDAENGVSVSIEYLSDQGSWQQLPHEDSTFISITDTIQNVESFSTLGWIYPTEIEPIDHKYYETTRKFKLPYPTLIRTSLTIHHSVDVELYSMEVNIQECVPDLANDGNCL